MISHSLEAGSLRSGYQHAHWVLVRALSGLQSAIFSLYPPTMERGQESSLGTLFKVTNPNPTIMF